MFPTNIFLFVHLERYYYGNMLSISVSPFVHLGRHSCGDVMCPCLSTWGKIVVETCFLSMFPHLGKHCNGHIMFPINISPFVSSRETLLRRHYVSCKCSTCLSTSENIVWKHLEPFRLNLKIIIRYNSATLKLSSGILSTQYDGPTILLHNQLLIRSINHNRKIVFIFRDVVSPVFAWKRALSAVVTISSQFFIFV